MSRKPWAPTLADGGMDGGVRKKTGENRWSSWTLTLPQDHLASCNTLLYLLQ